MDFLKYFLDCLHKLLRLAIQGILVETSLIVYVLTGDFTLVNDSLRKNVGSAETIDETGESMTKK